jgi:hypothetical protein
MRATCARSLQRGGEHLVFIAGGIEWGRRVEAHEAVAAAGGTRPERIGNARFVCADALSSCARTRIDSPRRSGPARAASIPA